MNQWLGHGMPNLKKIPRKPHPVGQEFKTVADAKTCCIIRLDLTGDSVVKEFDDQYSMKTIATVCRLMSPWFSSGRTIIADSWFGSPTMVRAMKNHGLYSIMQVKKKRYWPRGMPDRDILESLGESFGDTVCMKSTVDDVFLAALRDRKPKLVVSNCGTTSPSRQTIRRRIGDSLKEMRRPQIFDEYEENKGKVMSKLC